MQEHVWAPGRVNLIGEHIDYHGLPVLPMALRQRVNVTFERRRDRLIRAESKWRRPMACDENSVKVPVLAGHGPAPHTAYAPRQFEWRSDLTPVTAGDWENYLRAAALAVSRKWGVGAGIDAVVTSDLPAAAGLSSSSALIVAFALALLQANGWSATFEELMAILPEGEHFVGTRGGGMDHAAALASKEGCASLVGFHPLSVRHVPIPRDWTFLAADSLVRAEKSGAARERYNAARNGPGAAAHVAGESARVHAAVEAMERGDAEAFGRLLRESHASLRDCLKVSCEALDRLVDTAMESGATGARLTGAGFGGCALIFCLKPDAANVARRLTERLYGGDPSHIIHAEPGPGALVGRASRPV
jgi:galactokinase